jgi:hypothetical protein
MRVSRAAAFLAGVLFAASAALAQTQPSNAAEPRWWKGNLHTHSFWSDGDDYPEMIADWYKQQGYQFLAFTEHNVLGQEEKWIDRGSTPTGGAAYERYLTRFGATWIETRKTDDKLLVRVKPFNEIRHLFDEPGRFMLLTGEEVTLDCGGVPLHVNAVNLMAPIKSECDATIPQTLDQALVAAAKQQEQTGQRIFRHVNHPNWAWALTADHMSAMSRMTFVETYSGHPGVRTLGDEQHPSTERLWDLVQTERLRGGRGVLYGVGVDDAHNYQEMAPDKANPGRGWVMVRARHLTPEAIIGAMEAGDYYVSSGVQLEDVQNDGRTLTVNVHAEPGVSYRIEFIGSAKAAPAEGNDRSVGLVLKEAQGPTAAYTLDANDLYVRARVTSSKPKANTPMKGEFEAAWTQPLANPR